MKTAAIFAATSMLLGACVSAAEVDQSQAWAMCEKMLDRASRSSCMTKALSDANEERRVSEAKEQEDFKTGEKLIEDKAAIERAMGAPEDQTGTSIVREPFE